MPVEHREDLRFDANRPRALVLSGGGARGAFQVGVWEVLARDPRGFGRLPEIVSGTSAGAINAYLMACGLGPEEMLGFWLDLAKDPPVVANERFFRSLTNTILSLVVREPLRGPGRRLRELSILRGLVGKHSLSRASGLEAAILEFFVTARFDSLSYLGDLRRLARAPIDGLAGLRLGERDAVPVGAGPLQIGANFPQEKRQIVRITANLEDLRAPRCLALEQPRRGQIPTGRLADVALHLFGLRAFGGPGPEPLEELEAGHVGGAHGAHVYPFPPRDARAPNALDFTRGAAWGPARPRADNASAGAATRRRRRRS